MKLASPPAQSTLSDTLAARLDQVEKDAAELSAKNDVFRLRVTEALHERGGVDEAQPVLVDICDENIALREQTKALRGTVSELGKQIKEQARADDELKERTGDVCSSRRQRSLDEGGDVVGVEAFAGQATGALDGRAINLRAGLHGMHFVG